MVKKPRLKQVSIPEDAPDWYGTPLEELDFEWSPQEKLEIERYCQKILKNVAEQEMTPKERFEATLAGKPRDRVLIQALPWNVYSVRTLDSGADALKPIDVYRDPKLQIKAHLATVARFDLDIAAFYQTSYSEELWGAKVKMLEYGNPCTVGDTPISKLADLEDLEVPDPKKDGLSPGYFWACRELRRIYDEYGLTKVMPLCVSNCFSPMTSMMMIVGMAKFLMALHKDPELCKRSTALATEYGIKFFQAMQEVAHPDWRWVCIGAEMLPLKGNELIVDFHVEFARTLAPIAPLSLSPALAKTFVDVFLPTFYEKGALGPGGSCGCNYAADADYKKAIDSHRERDLYVACCTSDRDLLAGPASTIEEEVKVRCDYGKPYSRFTISTGGIDYWTPQAHLDAFVAACKKHGKY